MGALEDKLNAIITGLQQAASGGWSDELSPEISTKLPAPKDPEGYSRQYAAGSAENDMRENMRSEAADLERRFPKSYGSGKALGAAPGSLALPALSVPAMGLLGGLIGGVQGAGEANGEDVAKHAAQNAGIHGLLGTLGAAAPEALAGAKGLIQDAKPLAPELAPAGVQVNQSRAAILPPRGNTLDLGELPVIPKAGKTIAENDVAALEDLADAGDKFTSAGNKKLIERSLQKQAARTEPINRDVEYIKNFADQKEAGVAARAKEAAREFEPEAESAVIKTAPARGPKRVKVAQETVSVNGQPTLQKTVAEGVNPDDIGRLKMGMQRGTRGPVDMQAMAAPYKGAPDPTEVATKHFPPVEMTVEDTPTGLSWWLKDGRHRLQNALDHGATAINANVRNAAQTEGEPLFSGALPLKKSAPKPALDNPDDIKKYFER